MTKDCDTNDNTSYAVLNGTGNKNLNKTMNKPYTRGKRKLMKYANRLLLVSGNSSHAESKTEHSRSKKILDNMGKEKREYQKKSKEIK